MRLAFNRAIVPILFAAMAIMAGCGRDTRSAPSVVQVVDGFNNPESCAFSPDRRWLFVTNCASQESGADKRIGLVRGEGAISRLRVATDGTLTMDEARFISGLSTPLGIASAPRALGPYPAGSLFVCVGNALGTDASGVPQRDAAALGTAIAIFDPASGRRLGAIGLGPTSAVATAIGHALLLPNGIAIGADGDIAIADSGVGGERLSPTVTAQPGVVRLRLDATGAIVDPRFIPVPGGPNGVHFAPDGALLWVTCSGKGPEGGALFRDGRMLASNLGACDGIVVTRAGTIVVSRSAGDLVAIRPGRAPQALPLRFAFPSDIELLASPDGGESVVVPEQEAWDEAPWAQSVRVVRLPADF